MKKPKNFTAKTLILLLIASTLMTGLPAVTAQSRDITTYAYLSVAPNPIGVNQPVTVIAWVQPLPPTGDFVIHGLTVTITKPDSNIDTVGPLNTSAIASQFFVYTPNAVGTYEFQMSYVGETFPTGEKYLPSETPITELVVQPNPIEANPENPFPNDYWERPINARNRDWSYYAGNWLQRGYNSTYMVATHSDSASAFQPYSKAPRSAHIMWAKELALGGIAGGEFGSTAYYSGHTYEEKLTPPVIMNGYIYRRIYPSDFGIGQGVGGQWPGTVCEDLRTGEVIWTNNDMQVDQGQLYNYVSANQMGTIPYLWDLGTGAAFSLMANLFPRDRYKMYDGNTGELIATFENATAIPPHGYGLTRYDENGALLVYILIGPSNMMMMWNSTKAFVGAGLIPDIPGSHVGFIRNVRGTYDWNLGVEWVKPIPDRSVIGPAGPVWPVFQGITGDVMVAAVETTANTWSQIGYSATTGEELWYQESPTYFFRRAFGEGIFASWNPNTGRWYGFDASDGTQLWISDPADYPWGTYGFNGVIAYGKLYAINFDGKIHVFDINNGKQLFEYYSGDAGLDTPYGSYPLYFGPIVADEVVFAGNGEHSPTQPLYRGTKLHAVDATTGEGIWNISGWWAMQAIADGYLLCSNAEDNRMYVFGKGPSEMTVTASQVVTESSAVMIEGTILDMSTGQAGTPCISDEDMTAWMEYLYFQATKPEDAKGVPIKLAYQLSDGSWRDIDQVISDDHGNFGYLWTPPNEGTYLVKAFFLGSESYGSSSATTYAAIGTWPVPDENNLNNLQNSISNQTSYILIILVLVIVAIVLALYSLMQSRK